MRACGYTRLREFETSTCWRCKRSRLSRDIVRATVERHRRCRLWSLAGRFSWSPDHRYKLKSESKCKPKPAWIKNKCIPSVSLWQPQGVHLTPVKVSQDSHVFLFLFVVFVFIVVPLIFKWRYQTHGFDLHAAGVGLGC